MDLLALIELLLPEGTLPEIQSENGHVDWRGAIGSIRNEDDLFAFIHTVLRPYLHTISVLIGIADENGTISRWCHKTEGLTLLPLPKKVSEHFMQDNISGVLEMYAPDRRSALQTTLFNSGVREMLILPLRNHTNSFGFLCLLAKHHNTFPKSLQISVKRYAGLLSAATLKLMLLDALPQWLQEEDMEDNSGELRLYNDLLPAKLVSGIALRPVIQQVRQVAPTDATVLLTGETGTGKELFAEAIHLSSLRRHKAFVKINCAALPPQLIESELFGHEKGAFTGAIHRRIGKFEMAEGGTLFLDEIGELPLDMQAKLLRVIQEKEIERIGGTETIPVNVRIIAATNRTLEEEVRQGRFRQDLYYRLYVFPIHLPALRERREDIPLLLQHFARNAAMKYGKPIRHIASGSVLALIDYSWPGNIREMEHMVERAVISSDEPQITIAVPGNHKALETDGNSLSPLLTLAETERQTIIRALRYSNGRIRGPQGAADLLDIKPTTLEARMKKLGIVKEHVVR
ncbi:Transcriptional regulator containing GAF, AAA-type ATPase, and DNA-binding Fis domains [Chitinophaga sp. YR627]|uniref:sigma-54-dependent Fis family transcriptional regulator n=1 Tax=Chitinophaga sp. YR627 TaxID=1881041 RepID=UPI0008EA76ED|nr:sigma-54-dependent Fis family transcriptional regulator [Chitinophaga sp. YR627]SFM76180.1 Transcriptional regulator containing GAF, AAA-type ATPase, and DNA-binding Fis domains [Chitinophaga sp. YR627]